MGFCSLYLPIFVEPQNLGDALSTENFPAKQYYRNLYIGCLPRSSHSRNLTSYSTNLKNNARTNYYIYAVRFNALVKTEMLVEDWTKSMETTFCMRLKRQSYIINCNRACLIDKQSRVEKSKIF